MKKYSIVINHIQNDLYALIVRSWELDEEGNQINVNGYTLTNLTFNQVVEKINDI
jgi:hypothetical protein